MDILEKVRVEEIRVLNEFKADLYNYAVTPEIRLQDIADPNSPLAQNAYFNKYREGAIYLEEMRIYQKLLAAFLDGMDSIFEIRYQQFVQEDPAILGKNYSDMELKRLIDIEKNLNVYQELITLINQVMSSPEYQAQSGLNLDSMLAEYQEKVQDLQIRKEHYTSVRKHESDGEELLFKAFLDEYYALHAELEDWTLALSETEEMLLTDIMLSYPDEMKELALQMKDRIKEPEIQMDLDAYLNRVLANLDFISLQNRYRQVHYQDAIRRENDKLSISESEQAYEQIISQKTQLLNDYQDFVTNNPDFLAMEQPDDSFLVSLADVYYNMGELQWAVDFDHPEKALAYYRKTLEINPDFYLHDFALYNVAYLSAETNQTQKEQHIADWRELNPNKQRGDAQKLLESDFIEALNNYQTILADYPNSILYDETAYRLANLYFLIATDAERPIEWYAKANELYAQIIAQTNSPYRYEAMFQRAFVNMNISDENSLQFALQDFVNILNAVDSNQVRPASTAQELKINSLDQIAYCLVALDGVASDDESRGLAAINTFFADYQDESVLLHILDKASENKKELKLTRQSIDFLDFRLQKTPNALINPSLMDSVVVLFYSADISLRPGENRDQIRRERYSQMTNQFAKDSTWYNLNIKDKDLTDPEIANQLASIRNAYRQTQIVLYEAVRTGLTDQAYEDYISHTAKFAAYDELFTPEVYGAYTQLIDHLFKAKPAAYDADYALWKRNVEKEELLLLGSIADARKTADAYQRIYDQLVAYNQKYLQATDPEYFENEERAYSYAIDRDALLREQLEGEALQEQYAYQQEATLRFINALRETGLPARIKQADDLVMDMAHNAFNNDRYAEAKTRYLDILQTMPNISNNNKYDIYLNLAFVAENDSSLAVFDRFKTAEDYARQAMQYTSDGAKLADAEQMIKLQIQNSYNAAISENDHATAAIQFGRMADEFPFEKDAEKHLNFKRLQAEQYQLAGQYDQLIATYMYLASKEKADAIDEIYKFYYLSWTTADSLMHNAARAKGIKNEFIDKFPSSNYTFKLKVMDIEELEAAPATKLDAAEAYIALSEDVRAKRIDSGEVAPETIYMQAYNIYNEDQNSPKRLEVLDDFIKTYPNHPDVPDMLRTLASGYYVLKDNDHFELYAKKLFEKDKTQFDLYQGVAVSYMSRILVEYDTAYLNKDWSEAFKKRDEFKALEAKYRKEGLPLDTTEQYKAFAAAEAEYKEIQAQLAFLKDYDRQLAALENAEFMRLTPNQHVPVGVKSSFNSTLRGGKQKYLPNFRQSLNSQINKVEKLLSPANQQRLDTGRIIQALALEARIYELGIQIVQTQIEKFLDVATEVKPYRDDPEVVGTIWGTINAEYVYPFEDSANAIYMSLFTTFHLAGFEDANTRFAIAKLQERGLQPDFQKVEYPMGQGWTLSMLDDDDQKVPANISVSTISTPKGQVLGSVQIPAKTKLQAEFTLNSTIQPSFVFLQMIYPYNPEAFINGQEVDFVGFPVDSLDASQAITARYGYRFSGAEWNEKQNNIRLLFPNRYMEEIPARVTIQAYYDKFELEQARPRESMTFSSGSSWRAMIPDPESNVETAIPARLAEESTWPKDNISGFEDSQAQAIWVVEDSQLTVSSLAFETDFTVNGELISAQLEFVAPLIANVILNGQMIAQEIYIDIDEDPLAIYSSVIDLPIDYIRNGKNTLRIEVQNQTPYRGIMAEIKIDKYVKE